MKEGDVELGDPVGKGSYGTVYGGRWVTRGNKPVAVKVLELDNIGDDLEDIQKEIRNMWELKASPYVTQVYGSYVVDDQLWIVMEFLGGGNIQELRRNFKLPEQAIAIVLRETLLGLQYLHAENKIHRDIKAANILLSADAHVKLADFGVSAQLSDSIKKRHTMIGSPFWMAPEVIMETGHHVKADVWSVGITALEMADGFPPYYKENPITAIMAIPTRPAPVLQGDWSPEFKDFVRACLQKNPDQRPSAAELLDHPFVERAGPVESLYGLVGEHMKITYVGGESSGETLRRGEVAGSDDAWDF